MQEHMFQRMRQSIPFQARRSTVASVYCFLWNLWSFRRVEWTVGRILECGLYIESTNLENSSSHFVFQVIWIQTRYLFSSEWMVFHVFLRDDLRIPLRSTPLSLSKCLNMSVCISLLSYYDAVLWSTKLSLPLSLLFIATNLPTASSK